MKITKAFLTFGAILALVFFTGPKSALAEEVVEIKAATWHPVTHRLTVIIEPTSTGSSQVIDSRSNGLLVTVMSSGSGVATGQGVISGVPV